MSSRLLADVRTVLDQAMVAWLRSKLPTAMSVTYRGEKRTLAEWLNEAPGPRSSVHSL